jgi:hypothetical protein
MAGRVVGSMSRLRLVATAILAGAGVTALVAAQLPALPSTALADGPSTAPGSAFASSVVLAANPEYGGLSLVVRGGQSTASYTGTQAIADAQAVNLGYVGGLLNGPPNACYGSAGGPSATASFNALQAASDSGAASKSADGGVESVAVNPSPEQASATTAPSPIAIPGLLDVTAHAVSHVSYVSGKDQEADAATTMTVSLLGGLVTLNGLSWAANQETGATSAASGTFSMTSLTVAGKSTAIATPAELASALAVANKVLVTFGLTLTQPVESTDPVTGTVTIGPLRLQVEGTAITNTVLGALNPTETTVEEQIGKVLATGDEACIKVIESYVGDAELVAGIVEGILAGGGFIDLELGGASADTEDAPNFVNPLDVLGGNSSGNASGQLPSAYGGLATGANGLFDAGGGDIGASPATSGGATTSTSAPAQSSAPATQSATLVRCVTSSPSGRPGCWSGAATVGAAALLVVGGVLFVADVTRSRRRLIRPKETI